MDNNFDRILALDNEILGKVTNALPPYKNGGTNDMDVIRQNIGIRYGL